MAFSSNKVAQSLAGNLRMEIHSCNFDSVTSGTVSIGIKNILHMSFNNEVTAGAAALVTHSDQLVTIASVTANDTGSLLVIGNG